MSYNPINWQNDKIGGTKVNATNLNIMDKGIADAHDMLADHDNKINDFANQQIPEEYLQQAVDNYIAENQAGLATKEETEALDVKIDEVNSQLSSEIANVESNFTNGDNILLLPNETHNYNSRVSVEVADGKIILNGTLGSSPLRIKVTNGYDYSGDTSASWNTEIVDFMVVGREYALSLYAMGGEDLSGFTFVARDENGTSLLSSTKAVGVLTKKASHIQLFIPANSVMNNLVLYPVIEQNGERTPLEDIREVSLDTSKVAIKELDRLLKLVENQYYTTIKSFEYELLHEDNLGVYGDTQSLTTDGENLYYNVRCNGDTGNMMLRKYNLASGQVTLSVENHPYGHSNGMAYVPHENALYIVGLDNIGTVYKVNAETLEYISEFTLQETLSPVVDWYMGVGAVAYDIKREKIIYLLRGVAEADGRTRKGFAIFDKEMRFEKIIKIPYIESVAYSGINSDDNFIYLTISNPGTDKGEWLIAYDWHGNEVFRTQLIGYAHVEGQAKVGDVFYFADNRNYEGATIEKATVLETDYILKVDVLSQYNLNE